MPLRGVRGATICDQNDKLSILEATQELLQTLLQKNDIAKEDIASIFFSVTHDLDAAFPAVAARKLGLTHTPLLCLNEIPVVDSLEKCIRILIHINTDKSQDQMCPVYLKDAVKLRPDQAAS